MVGVYKESGRSFCTLTPPSAALYVMAGCMIKCEARTFMQTDSAYSVGLHGFVMWFHSMKPQNTIVMAMRAQLISNPNTSLWFIVLASIPRDVNRPLKATNQRMLLTQKNRKLMRATTNRKIKQTEVLELNLPPVHLGWFLERTGIRRTVQPMLLPPPQTLVIYAIYFCPFSLMSSGTSEHLFHPQ